MIIKFSYPFSKLFHNSSPIGAAKLLQVIETDYSDLTQEFKDYDTDFGKYPLPKKGPCILLIFQKNGGIFTTVRRSIPHKVEYYKKAVGQMFDIDLSYDVQQEIP
jgi:hypothetical protein